MSQVSLLVADVATEDRYLAPVGTHCVLELYGCSSACLNDVVLIKQALKDAATRANATLLNQIEHQFHPQGVTALALLAESHISIHTWPEAGYAAVDVFTCGEHTKPEVACQHLIETMQAKRHQLLKLPRRTSIMTIEEQQAADLDVAAVF